jgi:hypothetical protein
MVSDWSEWWDKYYKGNTKKYLDTLLSAKFSANPDKSLDIAKRQIYDALPLDIKWNQPGERSGTAYIGIVLDYFDPPVNRDVTYDKPVSVFQSVEVDPSVNMGLSVIPTASAEPEPVSLPSVYGGQYVPEVEPEFGLCPTHVRIIAVGSGIVAYDGVASCDTIRRYTENPSYNVVYPPFPQPEPVVEQVSIPNVFVETYPTPVTEPEPVVAPVTICIDIYRLSGGNVTASRETVDYPTMANYVNVQHLLVRECNQPVPTTQEVKTWYGYFEPEPEPEPPITEPPITEPPITEPPITEPPITVLPGIPGKFNTNILVGLLAGGALAVPILDDLLKTKKKRRR